MVLEIVSPTSVKKDTVRLPRLYREAGIQEYWLIDSRVAEPCLDIIRAGKLKYRKVRKDDGWVKSVTFGKEFRLLRRDTGFGVSDFTLEFR
jgi:Uma2 family endonuclease